MVSSIWELREKAEVAFGITKGALDILSTPPAITISASSVRMARAAAVNASRPDPHKRFTVAPETNVGKPERRSAILATFLLSSPA